MRQGPTKATADPKDTKPAGHIRLYPGIKYAALRAKFTNAIKKAAQDLCAAFGRTNSSYPN
jgi:spore coat polysaccharide biosynthesis predicted glycosyltransferase SpsG